MKSLQEVIRENEEIREKMKIVLETNQEQKANLKFVLLRIASKQHLQTEYEVRNRNTQADASSLPSFTDYLHCLKLKVRKQQLEMLDLLEAKNDLQSLCAE